MPNTLHIALLTMILWSFSACHTECITENNHTIISTVVEQCASAANNCPVRRDSGRDRERERERERDSSRRDRWVQLLVGKVVVYKVV